MKIKTREMPYEDVIKLPAEPHRVPRRPSLLFRTLVRLLSIPDLFRVHFSFDRSGIAEAGEGPYLILMNHSCFLDLKIASRIFYPMPYGIVCTSDGFVGKRRLMRGLGCIPTPKFVNDLNLIRDMTTLLQKKNISVLMYPEASYSFDGCATPLPRRLGRLIKMFKVPVLYVGTEGAFSHDPLYNGLQRRKVQVTAKVSCLFTREQVDSLSVDEMDRILDNAFSFDHFAWQRDNRIKIDEPFRADGLERVLYKCAHCHTEGQMEGKGEHIVCHACGKRYRLTEYGQLEAENGVTEFPHIPDWYRWERTCVREELLAGTYSLDTEVKIGMMVNYKAIYMVGSGTLHHDKQGFLLDGCRDKLHYEQKPLSSYGLYSDYFWYEIGDVICIGTRDRLYYCFPKKPGVIAKTRLAAEELYQLARAEVRA